MSLGDQAEFIRLRADVHVFNETTRTFDALLSDQPVRSTILYHTLLHEIGHWVQYHEDVLAAATAIDPAQDVARALYFSKPSSQREVYARSFADRLVVDFDPLSAL
jgi:hypothetical protein